MFNDTCTLYNGYCRYVSIQTPVWEQNLFRHQERRKLKFMKFNVLRANSC